MFLVSQAAATAIRDAFEKGDELSAAIELRRMLENKKWFTHQQDQLVRRFMPVLQLKKLPLLYRQPASSCVAPNPWEHIRSLDIRARQRPTPQAGYGYHAIAKKLGISRSSVYRLIGQ